MKVCFYIDTNVRDLPIAKYLSRKIKKSSVLPIFKSSLVKGVTYKIQKKYSPDIVITTSFNKNRTKDIAVRASESDSILVEFTSEQYFSEMFNAEKLLTWDINDKYKVDYFFCWGESYAEKLIKISNVPHDRIFIIGSPKLVHNKKTDHHKPSNTKNILMVSDYLLADFDQQKLESWNKEFNIAANYEEVQIIQKERLEAINTANQLGQRGFHVTFRLHPGENADIYKKNLLPCVRLSLGNSLFHQDLKFSDLVIGYTTTAIFEIACMEKRFISLRNYNDLDINHREFYKHVEKFSSKQLLNLTNSELNKAGHEIRSKLKYYSENIITKSNVDEVFAEACQFILNEDSFTRVRKKYSTFVITKTKFIAHINFIFRKLIANKYFYKLCPRFIKAKASNMVNSAHNMTYKDYEDFYADLDGLELTKKNLSFTLTDIGWKYNINLQGDNK
ncbi:hypothetical protein N9J68_04230 [Gammaproteobacteria bacterium]|nr:hypothetical protein [Gammaproteobacteria bacterium]MDA9011424.1 hypothetical protein [Gammaproteobacteria bacterium]MDA9118107.1 hypothetical protein [Gammaproteobacteria bacterium]